MTTEAPEPLVHAEAQYQNPAPIKPQSPIPAGVHDIEISWDRNEGYMRAIIGGQKWWFKEFLSQQPIEVIGTDNARGRINMRGMGVLTVDQLVLYRAPDSKPHPWVKGLSHAASYQRLCYRRANLDWRLRDERETKKGNLSAIKFVKGYVGDMQIEWEHNDKVAHVYHIGPWTLCDPGCFLHEDGGYAHLYANEE